MQPTLYEEDYVFVNKASTFSDLEHGEIVIIKEEDESKYYVKRVIGLPGDVINITNGSVYVNDENKKNRIQIKIYSIIRKCFITFKRQKSHQINYL